MNKLLKIIREAGSVSIYAVGEDSSVIDSLHFESAEETLEAFEAWCYEYPIVQIFTDSPMKLLCEFQRSPE